MIHLIFGTRSDIVKFSTTVKEMKRRKIEFKLIDIGEHDTSEFRHLLHFPEPDYFFGLSPRKTWSKLPKPFAVLLAMYWGFGVFLKLRKIFKKEGDVIFSFGNTMAVPLAVSAFKSIFFKKMTLVHVESGLRGNTKESVLADFFYKIGDYNADILLVPSHSCMKNLKNEKVKGRLIFTGDPTTEIVKFVLKIKPKIRIPKEKYILVNSVRSLKTNEDMENFVNTLLRCPFKILYTINPAVRHSLEKAGLLDELKSATHITIYNPLNYVDFLHLLKNSVAAITDSNGVQEECDALKKPCLVTNDFIQFPELQEYGICRVVSKDTRKTIKALYEIKNRGRLANYKRKSENILGDGFATKRIVDLFEELTK
jgi:UDP-N-acetylglucosamine 2-epimerase (non-hydrolysing)